MEVGWGCGKNKMIMAKYAKNGEKGGGQLAA